ncbi:MAG: hypothetical protein H6933_07205 [Burkholderiaceae bacterium]|nr:hypothetical protein [Rhodoferax sp.]MCP5284667.1 hypothetical protein [Burkholderiaceae bacterium]
MAKPEHWPGIVQAMAHVRAGALAAKTGRRFETDTDADSMCALVIEALAWWAVEERGQVQSIRDAAREVADLQERIDAAVTELQECVARSDALCSRFGLRVHQPMWHDDLGEAIAEARRIFHRWGDEPEVRALDSFETRSWYSPRPGVLDLVRIARDVSLTREGNDPPPRRNRWTSELIREEGPTVAGSDPLAVRALANKPGSGPTSERAQLRQLMAVLQDIGHRNGWDDGAPGPLDFLTDQDLSALCRAALGFDAGSDPFNPESVRKARASFTLD